MAKLPAFGITAHALQILTKANAPVEELDPKWFNWRGIAAANVSGIVPYAPWRLQIVCADPLSTSSASRWCKNTFAAGYECVFICAANEEPSIYKFEGLYDGITYSLVFEQKDDREENDKLLSELRELDTSLRLHWGSLLRGGAHRLKCWASLKYHHSNGGATARQHTTGYKQPRVKLGVACALQRRTTARGTHGRT